MKLTDRHFQVPLDVDGHMLRIGDRVKATPELMMSGAAHGTVVDLDRQNVIRVEFDDDESEHRFAAFLVRRVTDPTSGRDGS